MKWLSGIVAAGLLLVASAVPAMAADTKPHRVAIQVDQNDPAVMNLALNNVSNIIEYYKAKNEDVQVEVVTYGPGLHMLRADTSPVKDRIKQIAEASFPSSPLPASTIRSTLAFSRRAARLRAKNSAFIQQLRSAQ